MSLLSHEITLKLISEAKQGDLRSKEELVTHNIALVKSIVRGFLGRNVEYDDLFQIGSLGLLKAIDGYDASFGVRFSTYAVPMISGEIKRFIRDDGMVKVSRSLKENAMKIRRAQDELSKKTGKEPCIEELSAHTGLEKEEIVLALEAVVPPTSIDEPIFEDGEVTVADRLVHDDRSQILDTLLIKELLSKLSAKEKKLITLRFFMDKTQSEIAVIMGVSQVQISRLLTKTLQKLKKAAGE